MPQEQTCVTSPAIMIFADTASGWLPVGSARVEQHEGRQVLRINLDAMPVSGRLCLSLADVDVLRADGVAGHA